MLFTLCSSVVTATAAEKAQLQALEVRKLQNTITPKVMELEVLSAPLEPLSVSSISANIPSTPADAPSSRPRPVPSWKPIADNPNIRVFPILSDGKRLYVSVYEGGSTVSKTTEEELTQVYKEKGAPDSFEVGGRLKQELLSQMKIASTESVHWFLFEERTEHRLGVSEITNLIVKPNGAGDGVFGTLGIELTGKVKKLNNSLSAVGLASIGTKSLLRPGDASVPQWREIQAPFHTEKALDLADYISPISTDNSGSRSLSDPPAWGTVADSFSLKTEPSP